MDRNSGGIIGRSGLGHITGLKISAVEQDAVSWSFTSVWSLTRAANQNVRGSSVLHISLVKMIGGMDDQDFTHHELRLDL